MRKNRFDSDNPMDQFLFCFGSGDDENDDSGGALGYELDEQADYVDRVAQEVQDARSRGDDTDELEDYYSSIMGDRLTGEDIMSVIDRSTQLAPSSGDEPPSTAISFAAPEVLTSVRGEPEAGTRGISSALGREDVTGPYGGLTTGQFGSLTTGPYGGQVTDQFAGQRGPRFDEVDIFAMPDVDLDEVPGGAVGVNIGTPASAQIQEARAAALGSPNDIRNQENIVRNNIDLETGLPVSVRQANAPTFNTVPNYDETDYLDMGEGLSLVEARQKAVSDLNSRAGSNDLFNTGLGFGIVDRLLNTTLRPDQMAQNMLDEKGQAVYSTAPGQGIIGVVDPKTGNIQPTSGNFFNRELNPVYEQYRKEPESGGGDDQQAAPAVTAPVAPATCPPGYRFNERTNACEYVGQVYPGATPYSGQPITASTQYTGIGGLQPFVLQPTYTAQTPFQPLYRV